MPEWLRFVKGVVDCEDLPLSISREKAQDSRLVTKLRQATTRRLVSELEKLKRKNGEKFRNEFWPEFGHFIKEGVCQDYAFQSQLSKLLHFESSKSKVGELTTLEEYVGRMEAEQKEVRFGEERSDGLRASALALKSHALTFPYKTHLLSNHRNNSHPSSQPLSRFASLIADILPRCTLPGSRRKVPVHGGLRGHQQGGAVRLLCH